MRSLKTVSLCVVGTLLLTTAVLVSPNNSVQLPPGGVALPRSTGPETPPSWSRTRVQPTKTPSPAPKPVKTEINVVAIGIDSYWGVNKAIGDWNKVLKYTKLTPVAACPSFQPCVTIKYNPKIDKELAAETSFGYRNDLTIELNPRIAPLREALATTAHELGHVLGVPHITGTSNTVMNPQEVYRITPGPVDVSFANRDRTWTVAEAYDSSNKTVDVRAIPR